MLKKVAFYDGDVLLGEVAVVPYQLTWREVPPGPRSVFIEYTNADGAVGFSNPVLFLGCGE